MSRVMLCEYALIVWSASIYSSELLGLCRTTSHWVLITDSGVFNPWDASATSLFWLSNT